MGAASARDVAAVLTFARELAEIGDGDHLVDAALARLLTVIGGDVSGYNCYQVPARRWSIELRPDEPLYVQLAGHLPDTMDDHPLLQHLVTTCDPRPCRASDVTSQRVWRASTIFAEILKPMGMPHLLVIPTAVSHSDGEGYVIARGGRDFSDRERDMAEVLQAALVVLHHRRSPAPTSTAPPASDEPRHAGPLTPREVEVLRLVSRGCTAQAASSVLRISPRTVRKHLEHVYDKLEVHDRLLAVDRARDLGLLAGSRRP